MRYFFILILCTLLYTPAVSALTVEQPLTNPKLESEAKLLFKSIHCMVCGGQSLDESDASLAADMRSFIRKQLSEGMTSNDIKTYLVSRYGDSILLSPPVNSHTIFLWGTPLLLLLVGLGCMVKIIRQYNRGV